MWQMFQEGFLKLEIHLIAVCSDDKTCNGTRKLKYMGLYNQDF